MEGTPLETTIHPDATHTDGTVHTAERSDLAKPVAVTAEATGVHVDALPRAEITFGRAQAAASGILQATHDCYRKAPAREFPA